MPIEFLLDRTAAPGAPPLELPFQVFFAVYRAPSASFLQLAGLKVVPHPIKAKDIEFPLAMVLNDEESGMTGELSYDAATYEHIAQSHVQTFLRLLTGVVSKPHVRIKELVAGFNTASVRAIAAKSTAQKS